MRTWPKRLLSFSRHQLQERVAGVSFCAFMLTLAACQPDFNPRRVNTGVDQAAVARDEAASASSKPGVPGPVGAQSTANAPGPLSTGSASNPRTISGSSCISLTDASFEQSGGFDFHKTKVGQTNLYIPKNLAPSCKVPVIHFNNGSASYCDFYKPVLTHLASWGFLVSCYESPQTGSGAECVKGIETVYRNYPQLADQKIGLVGHSEGGGGAIACSYLLEKKFGAQNTMAVYAIEPGHGIGRPTFLEDYKKVKSPIFVMSGAKDKVIMEWWIKLGVQNINSEALWYRVADVGHFDFQESTKGSIVAYLRWKLLSDQNGANFIAGLSTSKGWEKMTADSPEW
jgi:hypothetical protein